jgi:hypothetical protein
MLPQKEDPEAELKLPSVADASTSLRAGAYPPKHTLSRCKHKASRGLLSFRVEFKCARAALKGGHQAKQQDGRNEQPDG